MTLLDFIRYEQSLTGTKIGCREGDCGACTILAGVVKDNKVVYQSATSCLMALGNAHGKHIVTIEGINADQLNLVQEAFLKEGATQCGFCTPGFIVSLTGFCLNDQQSGYAKAIDSVNGNICRCTGYKSIERAAMTVSEKMLQCNAASKIDFAVENNIVPSYFKTIKDRLLQIPAMQPAEKSLKKIGGGTDLYVQQHETIVHEELDFLFDKPGLNGITQNGTICEIGGASVVADMDQSPIFHNHFKGFAEIIKLVSSTPIRNMATIAGNFTNASPIGDLTIFFLALDAQLVLAQDGKQRTLALRDFYLGYKKLSKEPNEIIEKILFELPGTNDLFNFEKVCKRTYLDIASVNTAIYLKMNGDIIETAGISAGGVGPVPLWLKKSGEFLKGNAVSEALVLELTAKVQEEISPISDARGTDAYKRLLLSQLIKAHFIKLFPSLNPAKLL